MGSCEDSLLEVHEPSCQAAAIEKHLSSKKSSGSEQLPYLEDGLNFIGHNVGPSGELDGFLELSQKDNAGCVKSDDLMEAASVDRGTGLVCKSRDERRDMVSFIPRKLSQDEFGVPGGYLHERQNGIDDCNVETDIPCEEKVDASDENDGLMNTLHDQKKSLEVTPMFGSLRSCDKQDGQKDDWTLNFQEDVEEKNDKLAATETDICDQMMPSSDSEMLEVYASPRNGIEQEKQSSGTSLERFMVVMDNKCVNLAAAENDNHYQTWCSLDHETVSESAQIIEVLSNCVQQDDQNQILKSLPAEEVIEVMEGKSNVLPVIETSTCNQLFSYQGFDKSVKLMHMIGFPEKCVQQSEQKDDGPVSQLMKEGVMEKKSDLLERVETVVHDQMLSSLDDEMHEESDSFSCFTRDCCQHNDLEAKTVSSADLKRDVDGKNDASAMKENDACTQKTLHNTEMPQESSVTGCLGGTFDWQTDQTNGKDISCLTAETVPLDNLKKSDVDRCIQECLSPTYQTLKNLAVAESLGNCDQKNEQRDDRSGCGPFAESMPDTVEEESDVITATKVDVQGQKYCMEGEAYDLKEVSPEIISNSPQSCQPSGLLESVTYERSDVPHLLGKDVFGSTTSSNAAACSDKTDNEGTDLAANGFSSKNSCPDIGSSSSRRSNRIRKSSEKTLAKRAARKLKNKTKEQDLKIFKAERRKRSCLSKPARSSNWGLLGNITQFFEQSNGVRLSEIRNHGPSKRKVERGSRKRNKSQAGGTSQRSSGKEHASTTGIRLKVKVGKELARDILNIMVPEVIDTSASAGVAISEFDTKAYKGARFDIPNYTSGVEGKMGFETAEEKLQCFHNKLEEAKLYSSTPVSNLHAADKELEDTVISHKSAGDAAIGYLGVPTHVEVDTLGALIEKRYMDPGTSPDSEVINLVPESQVNAGCLEDFPNVAPVVTTHGKSGKKKDRSTHASDCFTEDMTPGMASINKVKATKKRGGRQRKDNEFSSSEILISSTCAKVFINSSSSKEFSKEKLPLPKETEVGGSKKDLQAEVSAETEICFHQLWLSESRNSNNLISSIKSMGSQLPRKSDEASKGRSRVSVKARSKRTNGCRQRGSEQKSVNKNNVKEKSDCDDVVYKAEDYPETGNCIADNIGKPDPSDNFTSTDVANLNMASSDVAEQHILVDNAWVRCDDCHKWRRIPVALVDSIGQTNCQWICKDNKDEAFADCSIPQEKSNAEINAELGLSDADEDAYDLPSKNKGVECRRTTVSKEHEFTRISTNQFLHRSCKTQTIDEIMVCHCKPHPDGGSGCGDECLNRMLNIECVQGTCPCGDHCSNQQFQKRKYAKMKWARCGKKGFGLRLEENISKGQFLIEYVGEVLDMHTYEARQREYASKGHKHFYFMTLNGSEVIDACAKGNLGRFINHSCDPNCRTEKWVVNGEICIGLFALRDIKKGEEVTFDYNYVRVVGAAVKKCYCGSLQCRGYIGGDPTSTEVIDQVDSDEEFLEPVMLEYGEDGDTFKNRVSRNSVELQVAESISKDRDKVVNFTTDAAKMEVASEIEDSMHQSVSAVTQLPSSLEMDDLKEDFPSSSRPPEISVQADDATSKNVYAIKQEISKEEIQSLEASPSTTPSKSSADGMVANKKSKSATAEEKRVFVKSRFLIKTPRESYFSKKGKVASNPLNVNKALVVANKSQVLSVKPKKLVDGTSYGRFEAVEEKLNELLDADGGISKRKDAPKVYLKLLLLTAASGASGNGEAIQSNRDLSMILDALLKTKSKVVLMDIINKNGLRMLHNMMKQYRGDFKKIPILRKLLKVLEYLAVREILTPEIINGGPPCPGMESFRNSILSLTEHNDKQVHQIARNFRDRWIPRYGRKFNYIDRDDVRTEFHRVSVSNRVLASQNHSRDLGARPMEAIDCASQSKLATASVDTTVQVGCSALCAGDGTKIRKRKSRWDQPAEEKPSSRSLQHDEKKIQSALPQKSEYNPPPDVGKEVLDHVDKGSRENSYCPHCVRNYRRQEAASCSDNEGQTIQNDVPPGFSSPLNSTMVSSNAPMTITDLPQQNGSLMFPVGIAVGHPQKKFISRLSVSYGMPLHIVQQSGSPQDGNVESWAIAPGMPFHPFPPLPPFPHDKKETPSSAVNTMVIDETSEEGQRDRHDPVTCYPNENNPSTTDTHQPDMDVPSEHGQQKFKRARGSSHDLGRRYFRQQKWNKGPPWIWNRDGWGCVGNNLRGGVCSTDLGIVTSDHRNSYCSHDVSCRVAKAGNFINQPNST